MRPHRFSIIIRLLILHAALILSVNCQTSSNSQPPGPPARKVETKVTFLSVGDIMLSRGVAGLIDRNGDPLLPFRKMDAVLKSTDFNFGNLESPISGNDRIQAHGLVFNAHTKDIAGLVEYNFKVLNLANNHAFDQGLKGLQFTRKILSERGITHMGTGDNLEEAWQPTIITINDLRVGFIGASYASVNDGSGLTRNDYVARIDDLDRLKKAITQLKSDADFIVVTMHAGTEDTPKADPERKLDRLQIDFAHAAIDYGADIVIGAHPHWIQNLETYNGKYIFYSLGNFIFDQHNPLNKEGLTLKITLHGEKMTTSSPNQPNGAPREKFTTRIEQIECLPVMIENNSTPRLANEDEAARILKRVGMSRKVINGEAMAKGT